MVSILSLIGRSSSYRNRNCAGRSAASSTARASSSAPAPPLAQTSETYAPSAPAASERWRTSPISASVSVGKRLMATTTGTPKRRAFSICLSRLLHPSSTAFRSSRVSPGSSGRPATTRYRPLCILSARTVQTITTASGVRPE